MSRATGIIWAGPVFDEGGYGSVSRNCLMGFKKVGFPVKVLSVGGRDQRSALPESLVNQIVEMYDTDVGSNPVGVVHLPPEYYPKVRFRGVAKRIGYTIFETDRIPHEWVPLCNEMDEIWLPSRFNMETFASSGVHRERIKILPYGVDTENYSPTSEMYKVKGKRGFSFLYVTAFDWRKGFDLMLEAYCREFSNSDDVSLIIKVFAPGYSKIKNASAAIMNSFDIGKYKNAPNIIIIEEYLSAVELRSLYNTCDLYISTDRANGWGMPCMEAMSMGKPAATIDWSGSTEFMNSGNSFVIKPSSSLVPVDERLVSERPMYTGHRWAEVRVEEVQRVMRKAYQDREELSKIAEKGKNDMIDNFSLEAFAHKSLALIDDVPPCPQGLFKPTGYYRRSIREIAYQWKMKLLGD